MFSCDLIFTKRNIHGGRKQTICQTHGFKNAAQLCYTFSGLKKKQKNNIVTDSTIQAKIKMKSLKRKDSGINKWKPVELKGSVISNSETDFTGFIGLEVLENYDESFVKTSNKVCFFFKFKFFAIINFFNNLRETSA